MLSRREQEQVGYILTSGPGGLLLVMAFFTLPSFCECDPAYELGAIILVMVASTGIRYASKVADRFPTWLNWIATITGSTSLTVLLGVGLRGTIDQIQRFL